jgi:hypothetical protein
MARPLRIEFPGAFYHVMNRGNTGMNIYRSVRDREKFLEYVGEAVKRYWIKSPICLAFLCRKAIGRLRTEFDIYFYDYLGVNYPLVFLCD